MYRKISITILVFLSVTFFCIEEFKSAPFDTEKAIEKDNCITITSWNIANLGGSKHDTILERVAQTIAKSDIVCIQEVITSPAGAKAVAIIVDKLKRKGLDWDYAISNPTSGEGSERYAMLWKKSKVRMYGKHWLEQSLADSINREPMLARFISGRDTFLVATMHSVPKSKNPARENKFLYTLDSLYEKDHLLIMGDFNASHKSNAFDKLYTRKMTQSLTNQKTTLKMEPNAAGEHLANEYDNIFYEKDEIKLVDTGVIDFSRYYSDLHKSRKLSDHIPVWGCYTIRRN